MPPILPRSTMQQLEACAESAGTMIAGRYRIERLLGTGGMAEVYRATDIAAAKPVAIKLMKAEIAEVPGAVERLRREGEILTSLRHPSIVAIETFGKLDDGRIFIAMELLDGETLGAHARRVGRMEPAALTPILEGAGGGLAAAHAQGIVHRDLKPDNIFLAKAAPLDGALGPATQVKVLDFGISKVFGSDKLTQTGEVVGTPRYMAPEQLSAERDLDGRVDIYALGVILYEALAGQPPFLAATPSDLIIAILHGKVVPLRTQRPDLHADIEGVVARAMARAKEARFDSVDALVGAWKACASARSAARADKAPARARPGMATTPLGSMAHRAPIATPVFGLSAGPHDANASHGVPSTRPVADVIAAPAMERPIAGGAAGIGGDGLEGSLPQAHEHRAGAADGVADAGWPQGGGDGVAGGEPSPSRALVPGTFSELAQITAADVASRQGIPSASAATATHSSAALAGGAAATRGDGPFESVPTNRPPSAAQQEIAPGGSAARAATDGGREAISTPSSVGATRRGGRLWLIAGALVAGALSALAVVIGLGLFRGDHGDRGASPEIAGPAPSSISEAAVAPEGAPPASPLPEGLEAPPTEDPAAATGAAEPPVDRPVGLRRGAGVRRHRRAAPEPGAAATTSPAAPPGAAFPPGSTTAELLAQARAALARGDGQACIGLTDRAIQAGAPAYALRLRGDCQLRAGDRPGAVASYERFCRIVPDHPSISEVRGIVEGLGGRCN